MRLLISVHLRFKSIVRDNIIGGTIDFMFSIKDRIDDIRG
jgi:CRISPR/Cas system CMR-associated protein Cmr5 small subunit